jgi:hypothetical protein
MHHKRKTFLLVTRWHTKVLQGRVGGNDAAASKTSEEKEGRGSGSGTNGDDADDAAFRQGLFHSTSISRRA